MYNTRNQFHTKARLLLNAHMQAKMQQMFGNGYDSGDIEKGFDEDSPQQATGYQKENRLMMRNHGFSNSSL